MDTLPLWILTVAYSAHVLEEYVLDWRAWAYKTSGINMEWTEFFLANFAVIVLGIASACVGFDCPLFSYMFVGLATVNALFGHITTTLIKKKISPGMITSVIFFLPAGIWAYAIAYDKGLLTASFLLVTLMGGFLLMLFPIMLQLLKRKINRLT